jgi:signal transduction histidine kinase
MFARLRNRILLLNLVLTAILMAAAATAIFILTGLESQNLRKLAVLSAAAGSGNHVAHKPVESIPNSEMATFSFDFDCEGNILSVNSPFCISKAQCRQAYEKAKAGNINSLIELEGRTWLYVEGNSVNSDNLRTITFMDVTDSNRLLGMLKIIAAAVGIFMLAAITGVSVLFAVKTVQPVSDAWRRQQQFIADASHELKTPLAVIQANYDVIVSNPDETVREQLKWMEYMKAGLDRMSLLIHDMLTLAAIESGSVVVKKEKFNISERITKVIRTMKASADEKLLDVIERIEPDVFICSDSEIIARVFTAFYENAIKYAPPCGQVRLSLIDAKKHVICSVSNNGEGIPQDDLANIFDRFYRSDSSRSAQSGGFGLGLTIAKNNLDLIGGKATVACSEDRITTFTFTLPR